MLNFETNFLNNCGYGNKEAIAAKIKELSKSSDEELIKNYLIICNVLSTTEKDAAEAGEIDYWYNFLPKVDELKCIKSYLEKCILNILQVNNCLELINNNKNLELFKNNYYSIKTKADKIILDLQEYKPACYKDKIKLITKIISNE